MLATPAPTLNFDIDDLCNPTTLQAQIITSAPQHHHQSATKKHRESLVQTGDILGYDDEKSYAGAQSRTTSFESDLISDGDCLKEFIVPSGSKNHTHQSTTFSKTYQVDLGDISHVHKFAGAIARKLIDSNQISTSNRISDTSSLRAMSTGIPAYTLPYMEYLVQNENTKNGMYIDIDLEMLETAPTDAAKEFATQVMPGILVESLCDAMIEMYKKEELGVQFSVPNDGKVTLLIFARPTPKIKEKKSSNGGAYKYRSVGIHGYFYMNMTRATKLLLVEYLKTSLANQIDTMLSMLRQSTNSTRRANSPLLKCFGDKITGNAFANKFFDTGPSIKSGSAVYMVFMNKFADNITSNTNQMQYIPVKHYELVYQESDDPSAAIFHYNDITGDQSCIISAYNALVHHKQAYLDNGKMSTAQTKSAHASSALYTMFKTIFAKYHLGYMFRDVRASSSSSYLTATIDAHVTWASQVPNPCRGTMHAKHAQSTNSAMSLADAVGASELKDDRFFNLLRKCVLQIMSVENLNNYNYWFNELILPLSWEAVCNARHEEIYRELAREASKRARNSYQEKSFEDAWRAACTRSKTLDKSKPHVTGQSLIKRILASDMSDLQRDELHAMLREDRIGQCCEVISDYGRKGSIDSNNFFFSALISKYISINNIIIANNALYYYTDPSCVTTAAMVARIPISNKNAADYIRPHMYNKWIFVETNLVDRNAKISEKPLDLLGEIVRRCLVKDLEFIIKNLEMRAVTAVDIEKTEKSQVKLRKEDTLQKYVSTTYACISSDPRWKNIWHGFIMSANMTHQINATYKKSQYVASHVTNMLNGCLVYNENPEDGVSYITLKTDVSDIFSPQIACTAYYPIEYYLNNENGLAILRATLKIILAPFMSYQYASLFSMLTQKSLVDFAGKQIQSMTIALDSGSGGKSSFLEIHNMYMRSAIAEQPGYHINTNASIFYTVINEKDGATPTLIAMKNCRSIGVSEFDKTKKMVETTLKNMLGGDSMWARALYKDVQEVRLRTFFIGVSNNYPSLPTYDFAAMRRINTIKIMKTFVDNDATEKKTVDRSDDEIMFAKKDPSLFTDISNWGQRILPIAECLLSLNVFLANSACVRELANNALEDMFRTALMYKNNIAYASRRNDFVNFLTQVYIHKDQQPTEPPIKYKFVMKPGVDNTAAKYTCNIERVHQLYMQSVAECNENKDNFEINSDFNRERCDLTSFVATLIKFIPPSLQIASTVYPFVHISQIELDDKKDYIPIYEYESKNLSKFEQIEPFIDLWQNRHKSEYFADPAKIVQFMYKDYMSKKIIASVSLATTTSTSKSQSHKDT